jgi:hypothetical protein
VVVGVVVGVWRPVSRRKEWASITERRLVEEALVKEVDGAS